MLRRAANNAYSWWWASHVRTKQSKWLEENLKDIEEKVQYALKLLEDDGDSFAKRANMYYKSRPELISFIEESFKAYRALAERYDHISKELQNANTTIASVFPDQVPEFAEDDDDGPVTPRGRKTNISNQNVPKVPEFPIKDSEAAKMLLSRKQSAVKEQQNISSVVNKSGLSKTEAVAEIDRLQKEILVLQTEKEFVKSSYEDALAKYWEIEKCIVEKQGRVCSLQDEFDEGAVLIEDKEAQMLMSTSALKSCKEKLDEMRDKHEKNVKESEITRKEIGESTDELGNLSDELLGDGSRRNEEIYKEKEKLESLEEKVNEEIVESEANSCRNITDVADKIDELVNDVLSLERLFTSQAALIQRLREEIDDLKAQIKALQKEHGSSQSDEDLAMKKKLREMEEKLKGIQDIDQEVEQKSQNIEIHLTRAHLKLTFLSKRLKSLKQEGEEDNATIFVPVQDAGSLEIPEENVDDSVVSEDILNIESASEVVSTEKDLTEEVNQEETATEVTIEGEDLAEKDLTDEVNQEETTIEDTREEDDSAEKDLTDEVNQEETNKEDDLEKHIPASSPKPDIRTTQESDETLLQKLLAQGIEGREKHLLTEYTKVLRNYKELKKILEETEEKLKRCNNMKDEEIRAKEQQREQLFMLFCKEDNATKAITGHKTSQNKKQLGARVDALLSENLNILVRFSVSFGQIQQFDNGIKDLHVEILKIIKQKNQDGGGNNILKSNVRPLYKHLSEIRNEMTVWLEKNLLLKEEISNRASTLRDIQSEILEALKPDSEDPEMKLTAYQGAKFDGEVSNMTKENDRIAEELQTGLDQVTKLMKDAETTLQKLNDEFSLSESNAQTSQYGKTRIPLRSFIFDRKPKKQRLSLFSCIQPSMYKKKPTGS